MTLNQGKVFTRTLVSDVGQGNLGGQVYSSLNVVLHCGRVGKKALAFISQGIDDRSWPLGCGALLRLHLYCILF